MLHWPATVISFSTSTVCWFPSELSTDVNFTEKDFWTSGVGRWTCEDPTDFGGGSRRSETCNCMGQREVHRNWLAEVIWQAITESGYINVWEICRTCRYILPHVWCHMQQIFDEHHDLPIGHSWRQAGDHCSYSNLHFSTLLERRKAHNKRLCTEPIIYHSPDDIELLTVARCNYDYSKTLKHASLWFSKIWLSHVTLPVFLWFFFHPVMANLFQTSRTTEAFI